VFKKLDTGALSCQRMLAFLLIHASMCVRVSTQTAKFEVLIMPFHSAQITGLDVCLRKPLFATCSIDKSVRLWNLETWYGLPCTFIGVGLVSLSSK